MSFYSAVAAENGAEMALRGTGLKGWHVFGSDGDVVLIHGPSGFVSKDRLYRLGCRWRSAGGIGVGVYKTGSQSIRLFYTRNRG